MPKLLIPPRESAAREGPGRRVVMAALLALALAVPAYEGGRVCLARWRSMYGQSTYVETPVTTTLVDSFRAVATPVQKSVGSVLHNVPWNPSLTIPVALAWAFFAIQFLRRS